MRHHRTLREAPAGTHNHCRDHWKHARRRRELLDQEFPPALSVVPGMGTGATTTVDYLNDDPDDTLNQALARLSEKHRLPLLLFYFDGRDTVAVAEALDITVSAAATRLCRARRALRAILEVRHD